MRTCMMLMLELITETSEGRLSSANGRAGARLGFAREAEAREQALGPAGPRSPRPAQARLPNAGWHAPPCPSRDRPRSPRRPHRPAQRHRHRIDQAAIDQHAPLVQHRGHQPGERDRGAHGSRHAALVQPDLAPGGQFGGDAGEALVELGEVAVDEVAFEKSISFWPLIRPPR